MSCLVGGGIRRRCRAVEIDADGVHGAGEGIVEGRVVVGDGRAQVRADVERLIEREVVRDGCSTRPSACLAPSMMSSTVPPRPMPPPSYSNSIRIPCLPARIGWGARTV